MRELLKITFLILSLSSSERLELEGKHNPFSNKDKETLRLGTNYRSFNEVIQFNNAFFRQLSDKFENPDYKNLYEITGGETVFVF